MSEISKMSRSIKFERLLACALGGVVVVVVVVVFNVQWSGGLRKVRILLHYTSLMH